MDLLLCGLELPRTFLCAFVPRIPFYLLPYTVSQYIVFPRGLPTCTVIEQLTLHK